MKTIAIVIDRWSPQTTKQDGDRTNRHFPCDIWTKRIELLNVEEVSTKSRNGVLRLQRDAWSMVYRLKQAGHEYATLFSGGFVHWGWRPLATASKITSRTT